MQFIKISKELIKLVSATKQWSKFAYLLALCLLWAKFVTFEQALVLVLLAFFAEAAGGNGKPRRR